MDFTVTADAADFKIEDCFFFPRTWDEDSKRRYTEWLARMPESHPSKNDPTPWLEPRSR